MNALTWWIDRWRKSSAYTAMTLAEQGAYRNLLDEATLRGGALPLDDATLAKACGDPREWRAVRKKVLARFTRQRDGYHNETLDLVLAKMQQISAQRSVAGHLGADARWHDKRHGKSNGKG